MSINSYIAFLLLIVFGLGKNISFAQSLFGGLCPVECDCGLDEKGRMEMSCFQGRMTELPTTRMSPSTEIIKIIPPDSQPNHLTIGRFFKQLKKLEELHIVNSNIPNIGENSFWGVQSLRTLNLQKNDITLIVQSNFKGLVSLERLDLSRNKIVSFVSASFSALVKLRELNLAWNRASKLVERLFYNLHMLERLDLSGNSLRELTPDVFRDIWKLKILKCRSCRLKTINPLLYALLPDLRIFDLGENEFRYLNREEFGNLIHLRELYLDGNQLSSIIDDAFRTQNFWILNLSYNRIARIDRNAFFNTTIGNLDLSSNKFEILDPIIFSTLKRNLTSLNLSQNPKLKLSSLSIVLSEMTTKLKNLSIAGNNYEEIQLELFDGLDGIQHLNLSSNQLTEIYPIYFRNMRRLETLDLSNNRLKGLNDDFLNLIDQLHQFKDLRLYGNQFACDLCNIPVLLKWIQYHNVFSRGCQRDPFGLYCLRCSSPPAFYDRALITVKENELSWCKSAEPASILADDPKFSLFIACIIIILLLFIATIGFILHAKWHAAHYYTHEEDRQENGTRPNPTYQDLDPLQPCDTLISDEINSGTAYYFESNGNKPKMVGTIDKIGSDPHFVNSVNTQDSLNICLINENSGNIKTIPQLSSFKGKHSTNFPKPVLPPQIPSSIIVPPSSTQKTLNVPQLTSFSNDNAFQM